MRRSFDLDRSLRIAYAAGAFAAGIAGARVALARPRRRLVRIDRLVRVDRTVAPLVALVGAWVLGLAALRPWRLLGASVEAPQRRITETGLGPSSPAFELPDDTPSLP